MKIAIRDVCLKNSLDRVFSIARNLGYAGVEITLRGREIREHPIWTRAGLRALRADRETARIEIASINLHRFRLVGLVHADERVRQAAQKLLRALIPRAAVLEVPTIHIPFRGRQAITSEERRAFAVEALVQAAELAETHDRILAIGTDLPAEEIRSLVEEVGSERVRVDYDVLDGPHRGEDAGEALRLLIDIVHQIRVRDLGEDGTVRSLGMGELSFQSVVQAVREVEFDGYCILDVPPGDDPVASAAANLAFWQEILQSAL